MPNLETRKTQLDYILLDGSGSMQDKWWNTLDAIEAYIAGLRAENVNSQIVLSTFDTVSIDYIHRDVPIADWRPLREAPIGAFWTSTPLYDAINSMCRRLRDWDPPRCSIVIATDGGENASQVTSLPQAKTLLDWCRAKGWQITFIGASFDNAAQAALLGADPASAIGVSQKHLADATAALAAKRARYGLYGEPMHYTDAERQQFGGYLSGPQS